MPLPPKAVANVQMGLRRLQVQPKVYASITHFTIVRFGGEKGVARVVFGKRYADCSDANIKKIYDGDAEMSGTAPTGWFHVRGAVRASPGGAVELIPSTKENRVLSAPGILRHVKDLKKALGVEKVPTQGIQRLLDATPVKAENITLLLDQSAKDETLDADEPEASAPPDDAASNLGLAAGEAVKNASARAHAAEFEAIVRDLATIAQNPLRGSLDEGDRRAIREALISIGERLTTLRAGVTRTTLELKGAVFGTTRHADSLALLEELQARAAVAAARVDELYHSVRNLGNRAGGDAQNSDIAELAAAREREQVRSVRRENHGALTDVAVKTLIASWPAIERDVDTFLRLSDKLVAELMDCGPEERTEEGKHQLDFLAERRKGVETFIDSISAAQRRFAGEPDGEHYRACADYARRGRELDARIVFVRKSFEAVTGGDPDASAASPESGALSNAERNKLRSEHGALTADLGDLRKQASKADGRVLDAVREMRSRLDVFRPRITVFQDRVRQRRAPLASATGGSVRFKDSLQFLDELIAYIQLDLTRWQSAYDGLPAVPREDRERLAELDEDRELAELGAVADATDVATWNSRSEAAAKRRAVREADYTRRVGMDMTSSRYTPGQEISVEANFAEGMQASVKKVTYRQGGTAIVKEVRNDEPVKFLAAATVGIPDANHNLLGRAVGTSRLARLLGTSIVPDTEPGLHDGKPQQVQQFVPGHSSVKEKNLSYAEAQALLATGQDAAEQVDRQTETLAWRFASGEDLDPSKVGGNAAELERLKALGAAAGGDEANPALVAAVRKAVQDGKIWTVVRTIAEARGLDVTSPTVQQSLANAQLMDLIAGQVDRNPGNFIYTEENGSSSAKLIDNDMSFGRLVTDISEAGLGELAKSCPMVVAKLPRLVDAGMAERILAVTDEELRRSLDGTGLTDEEVAATVSRMSGLKQHLLKLKRGEIPGGRLVDTWDEQTAQEQLSEPDNYLQRQSDDLVAQIYAAPLRFKLLVDDLKEHGASLCQSLAKARGPKRDAIFTGLDKEKLVQLLELDHKTGGKMRQAFLARAPALLSAMLDSVFAGAAAPLKALNGKLVTLRAEVLALEDDVNGASRDAQQLPLAIMRDPARGTPESRSKHEAQLSYMRLTLNQSFAALIDALRQRLDGAAGEHLDLGNTFGFGFPSPTRVQLESLDREALATEEDIERVVATINTGKASLNDAESLLANAPAGPGSSPVSENGEDAAGGGDGKAALDATLWMKGTRNLLERLRNAEALAGAMVRGCEVVKMARDAVVAVEGLPLSLDAHIGAVEAGLEAYEGYRTTLLSVAPALARARSALVKGDADLAAFTAIKPATEDADALLERVTNKRGLVNDAILELESATRKLDDLATRVARLRAECARIGEPARLAAEAAQNAARAAAERAALVAAEKAKVAEFGWDDWLTVHRERSAPMIASIRDFARSPTWDTYVRVFPIDNSKYLIRQHVTGALQFDAYFLPMAPTITRPIFSGNAEERFSNPLKFYGAGKDKEAFFRDHAATRGMSEEEAMAYHAAYLLDQIPMLEEFRGIVTRLYDAFTDS